MWKICFFLKLCFFICSLDLSEMLCPSIVFLRYCGFPRKNKSKRVGSEIPGFFGRKSGSRFRAHCFLFSGCVEIIEITVFFKETNYDVEWESWGVQNPPELCHQRMLIVKGTTVETMALNSHASKEEDVCFDAFEEGSSDWCSQIR